MKKIIGATMTAALLASLFSCVCITASADVVATAAEASSAMG